MRNGGSSLPGTPKTGRSHRASADADDPAARRGAGEVVAGDRTAVNSDARQFARSVSASMLSGRQSSEPVSSIPGYLVDKIARNSSGGGGGGGVSEDAADGAGVRSVAGVRWMLGGDSAHVADREAK